MQDQLLRGVINAIEGHVAIVLVGDEREEWDFPMSIVPAGASTDTVLLLERTASSLRVVDVDLSTRRITRHHPMTISAGRERASRGNRQLRRIAGR